MLRYHNLFLKSFILYKFHWIADTPVVTLEFGTNSNSTIIREGADVYFECNIKSNPWVYKVSWRHNVSYLYLNVYNFL